MSYAEEKAVERKYWSRIALIWATVIVLVVGSLSWMSAAIVSTIATNNTEQCQIDKALCPNYYKQEYLDLWRTGDDLESR